MSANAINGKRSGYSVCILAESPTNPPHRNEKKGNKMNWIKKNWLSLIAIVLSITAWFKFERIAITSQSIEWCFPIGIAIISIGVTVILGVQIWNALSIDRRIKNEVKSAKSEIKACTLCL